MNINFDHMVANATYNRTISDGVIAFNAPIALTPEEYSSLDLKTLRSNAVELFTVWASKQANKFELAAHTANFEDMTVILTRS
jgi:hypothetical protein